MPLRSAAILSILSLVASVAQSQTCGNSPPPDEDFGLHGPNGSQRSSVDLYAVSVSPLSSGEEVLQASSGHTVKFLVLNTGDCPDGYGIVVTRTGTVTSATAAPTGLSLDPGQSDTITVTYGVGASPGGWIAITATGSFGSHSQGMVYVTVDRPAGAPVVDVSPYNFNSQNYSRCAVSCFAAIHAQSTVPYFSLDTPRNVTLIYNGDRVKPKPFVLVNVSPDVGYGQTPTEYQLRVQVNGVRITFVNGDSVLRFAYSGSAPIRIGGQFDGSSYATGMYRFDITVRAKYSSAPTTIENAYQARLLIVNATAKPYGRGWNIGGIERLYAQGDSALVVDGDGSAVYFERGPDGSYVTPAGEFSQLVLGSPGGGGGWTRQYPDSTKIGFNSSGFMTEIRDRFNSITTVSYDGSNRVSKIRDPLNFPITLTYDANGLHAIADSMGRVTQVTVNTDTALTLIKDPDLIGTSFAYDASKRLSTVTDRRGFVTTFGYDASSGKLVSITAPSITFVAANGNDSTGSPVTTQTPWQKGGVPYNGTGGTPFTAPKADTVYARVTDPAGHVTRFTVNRWGTSAVGTDALGRSDSSWFDANGMPIRTKHPTGAVDSAVYNANGLPTWTKLSGLPASNIRYAAWAQPDSIWRVGDSSGVRRSIGANGRVDWERKAGGTSDSAITRYHYDSRGRPDSVIDPMNHLVQRTWYGGTNGNRSKDSSAASATITYTYDSYGRPVSTARFGFATTTTYYSITNRPDSVRDGVNTVVTKYSYDNIYLTGVRDPKGQLFGMVYNAVGWLTQRTDPTGHSDSYKYTRDGLRRRWTNRRGHVLSYLYDVAHRVTQKSGDSTATETWGYPSDTAVVATTPLAQDSAIVNRHGQPIRAATVLGGQTFSRRYVYTNVGTLDSVIPSGAGISFRNRKYLWNTRTGALKEIRFSSDTTRIGTDRDGLATSMIHGGDSVYRAYSAGHWEGAITLGGPAVGPEFTRYLNYQIPGKLQEQIFASGQQGHRYRYDGLGRLASDSFISWQGPPPPCDGQRYPELDDNGSVCVADEFGGGYWRADSGVTFPYDSAGNRRDKGGQYLTGNRISQFDGCTYQTDLDGNVTQRACGADTVTFKWSAESRLTSMGTAGQTISFYYDTQGQLIRKDVNGTPQAYLIWDQGSLLAEVNASGMSKRLEYSYLAQDSPHAMASPTRSFDAHGDGMGNVIGLKDTSMTPAALYAYDTWGQSLGLSDTLNRARFKGALWLGPERDFYFMRARWYDPHSGRFLSEDPMGVDGGVNPYVFASNDPINARDPSGLLTCADVQVIYIDGTPYDCTQELLDVGDEWFRTHHGISLDEAWDGTTGDCLFTGAGGIQCAPGSQFVRSEIAIIFADALKGCPLMKHNQSFGGDAGTLQLQVYDNGTPGPIETKDAWIIYGINQPIWEWVKENLKEGHYHGWANVYTSALDWSVGRMPIWEGKVSGTAHCDVGNIVLEGAH